jgi:hypothetical protein
VEISCKFKQCAVNGFKAQKGLVKGNARTLVGWRSVVGLKKRRNLPQSLINLVEVFTAQKVSEAFDCSDVVFHHRQGHAGACG